MPNREEWEKQIRQLHRQYMSVMLSLSIEKTQRANSSIDEFVQHSVSIALLGAERIRIIQNLERLQRKLNATKR